MSEKRIKEYDIIEPIGKRVLIRKDEDKKETRGGIKLPDNIEIPTITGRVVAVSAEELVRIRVRPYYLYQCDPVVGTSHFRTTVAKGIELISQLRGHTSGYAVPTYVIDAPGGGGKVPVQAETIQAYEDERLIAMIETAIRQAEPAAKNESVTQDIQVRIASLSPRERQVMEILFRLGQATAQAPHPLHSAS